MHPQILGHNYRVVRGGTAEASVSSLGLQDLSSGNSGTVHFLRTGASFKSIHPPSSWKCEQLEAFQWNVSQSRPRKTSCKDSDMLRVALQTDSGEVWRTRPQHICKLKLKYLSVFDWCRSCVKHKHQLLTQRTNVCVWQIISVFTCEHVAWRSKRLSFSPMRGVMLTLASSCYVDIYIFLSLWSCYRCPVLLQARPRPTEACMWPCVTTSCPGTPWATPRRRASASATRWAANAR